MSWQLREELAKLPRCEYCGAPTRHPERECALRSADRVGFDDAFPERDRSDYPEELAEYLSEDQEAKLWPR